MGVPKFYRWISERYPCLSEEVKEFQLPEFDNLYLDMNGIIHVCSHPDDDNPHFRITEEKIFKDICHYIDFLFRMIKPRQVFFMAVDGVAPRAKMNQQRGRRFRSAREAEQLIEKAKKAGEVLPTEKRFDSNCITPGTPFMVRLQEHLKYFVMEKITNDPLWQGPKIYLSGHETPGEGEHKVMDYIRWSKSQPGYDCNTRHCLYGLDADLIMLGLTSHEPHFSLLREEVRFGGKKDKNKRTMTPEETTFHLLHLSLLRDYLAYEFSPLKARLPFQWDLERIIDDWILMGFLVGNDFIPHLPRFHIHRDALPILWNAYMNVLPTMDGYINEGGYLNLPRLEKYFQELTKFDVEEFESAFSDLSYLESKLGGKSINESAGHAARMRKLKPFQANGSEDVDTGQAMGGDLEDFLDSDFSDEEDGVGNTLGDEFILHKKDYYMSKMNYTDVTPDVLREQAHGYIKAIQWILLYYFEGVPSWSWYFPHHYAPYISDVRGFKDMDIIFDLSTPFLPFQQLMAVLPAASKELLPPGLQPLMTEATSPVVDFYPVNFETDLNGKQQEWEAVVLIPFIDENRLLSAMAAKQHLLTSEEKSRNAHGPHLIYQYTPDDQGFYPSSIPGVVPDLACSRAKLSLMAMDLFRIPSHELKKGLADGVNLNVYFPGFPTLRHLPHTHELNCVGVKVFQHNSRSKSIVLHVISQPDQILEKVADEILGKTTFVSWPHLHEARVVAVANESFKIELVEESPKKKGREAAFSFNRVPLDDGEKTIVAREANSIKERRMDRFAIDVGNTEIIVYASPMTGRRYTYGHHGVITLEKQFATGPIPFAYQMTVSELLVQESSPLTSFQTLEEVFPVDSTIFMLGNPHYGAQGKVIEILTETGRVRIALNVTEEPDMRELGQMHVQDRYLTAYHASQTIGIDAHIMSRITGSVFVEQAKDNQRVNVGLNLKFTKRGEEVPGYTRKEENGWTYSRKCVDVVSQYISRFQDVWLRVQRLGNDNISESDLFPAGSISTLKAVTEFLQELPSAKAPRMKFGAEILDEEQVARIEKKIANLNRVPNIVKIRIKPHLLFRPMAGQGSLVPDPEADFFLYDRVVVVKSGYSVPFGKRGTVIGIPPDEGNSQSPHRIYDVVFDEAFTGGITLRCSANKGYRVPGSAMINLTFGEFRKNRPPSQRVTVGAWNGGKTGSQKQGKDLHGALTSSNKNNTAGRFNDRAAPYSHSGSAVGGSQQQQQQLYQQQQLLKQQAVFDSKGQPLFGQVFSKGRNVPQNEPKFVTPKVSVPQHVMSAKKPVPSQKTDSVDFDSVWKTLVSQEPPKTFPPKEGSGANIQQRVPTMSSILQPKVQPQWQPSPTKNPSVTAADLASSLPPAASSTAIKNLFEDARAATVAVSLPPPQSSTENEEFLAMFNLLKTQSEEMRKSSVSPQASVPVSESDSAETEKSTAASDSKGVVEDVKALSFDNALKQLLKIGNDGPGDLQVPASQSSSTEPALPSKPARNSPSYGRQVSLQELFDEASKHLKHKHPTTGLGAPLQTAEGRPLEIREPIAELESYCQANNLPSPSYEFKLEPKKSAFIANVILSGRGRYEGSMCNTKDEAVKSAARMALLCLKSKPNLVHPALASLLPVPPRPGMQAQFFSPNSAFSPIGLPGQTAPVTPQQHPPSMLPPPHLLTPQHFISHPPMTHSLHRQQFSPQQQMMQTRGLLQHHQQQFQQQMQSRPPLNLPPSLSNQPLPPSSFQSAPSSSANQKLPSASASMDTGIKTSASTAQPFIPLQVSRNQTQKGKKENQLAAPSDPSSLLAVDVDCNLISFQEKSMPTSTTRPEKLTTQTSVDKKASSASSENHSGHMDVTAKALSLLESPADLEAFAVCPPGVNSQSTQGQNGAVLSPTVVATATLPSSTNLSSATRTTTTTTHTPAASAPGQSNQNSDGQGQGLKKPKRKSRLAANFSLLKKV